jgi:predicted nucleic acid-binding protein
MILDSTFLIDFEREARRSENGPATRFLAKHVDDPLMITFTIAGELAAGESLGNHRSRWEAFIQPFNLLTYTAEVGWHFGEIYRELKSSGHLIGANDLWIAATAKAYRVSLVTRNHADFSRIQGLVVFGY